MLYSDPSASVQCLDLNIYLPPHKLNLILAVLDKVVSISDAAKPLGKV